MVRTVFAALIFLAIEIAWYTKWRDVEALHFLPMIAPLVFVSPLMRALARQYTSFTITGDRLRMESGAFSKSSRTIQLSKVQDVSVQQTVVQRAFGVGHIWIETAGQSSRVTLDDIDNPQAVADQLLDRAHQGTIGQGGAN
jgi:putative membrane protein